MPLVITAYHNALSRRGLAAVSLTPRPSLVPLSVLLSAHVSLPSYPGPGAFSYRALLMLFLVYSPARRLEPRPLRLLVQRSPVGPLVRASIQNASCSFSRVSTAAAKTTADLTAGFPSLLPSRSGFLSWVSQFLPIPCAGETSRGFPREGLFTG